MSSKRKGVSTPLRIQTVTINSTVPKIYKYQQASSGLNTDIAVQMMLNEGVRDVVISALKSLEYVEAVILGTTGARGGKFKTDIHLVSLDSLRNVIDTELSNHGYRSNQHVITVLSGFFLELLSRINVVTKTGMLELFDLKVMYVFRPENVVDEMKKVRISYALDMFDMGKIEVKREIGIAAVVAEITSQAYAMEIALLSINNVQSEFDTLLALIRSYVLRDFSQISDDELTFFDNEKFLMLANNISFSQMALLTQHRRPKASYNFWIQCLERVDSAIKSSAMFQTIEIGALKEYYSLSMVNDQDGLKKGFILSRNIVETKPLQIFYKLEDTLSSQDGFWRLHEDSSTQRQLDDAYSQACKLTMKNVHDYAHTMLSKFVKAEDELFSAVMDISQQELVLIAASFGAQVEVLNGTDGEEFLYPVLVFRLDTTNSKIRTPLKTFLGTMKTEDPLTAILIEGKDLEGKVSFTDSSLTVENPKNKAFVKLSQFLDRRLSSDAVLALTTTIGRIKLQTKMEDLLSTQDLSRLVSTKPQIGEIIYNSLFEMFMDLEEYEKHVLPHGQKQVYRTSASIAFVDTFKDLIISRDLADMTYVAKGLIWDHLVATGKSSSEGRSILSDKRVETELQILLGIEILDKLGFLTDVKSKTRAINIFKDAQLYELLSL